MEINIKAFVYLLKQYSRLVYTPGHIQADEGEEEVDNEHLKRYISTRRSLDPVFTLPLPTYFRSQVKYLNVCFYSSLEYLVCIVILNSDYSVGSTSGFSPLPRHDADS